MVRASICVLTYKRPEALKACLNSIIAARLPNDCVLIIIDNADSKDGEAVYEAFDFKNLNAHYVHEPEKGVVHARNRAMDEAFITHKCDWLCFIDDDETVNKNWLSALLDCQSRTRADAVMGNVIFDMPMTCPL
jgi:glycosyltransferase involved in cell wall biosynthesis